MTKLLDVYRRILTAPLGLTGAERYQRATEGMDAPALADLAREADLFALSLRSMLLDRLFGGGPRPIAVSGRAVEVRLGCLWYVGGSPERLHYCVADEPTDDGRDWYDDGLDPTVSPRERVIACADDVTVVLTEDEGLSLVTTSKRCPGRGGDRA